MSATDHDRQDSAVLRLRQRGDLLLRLLQNNKRTHQKNIVIWGGLQILASGAMLLVAWLCVSALVPYMVKPLGLILAIAFWGGAMWLVWRHWVQPLQAVPNLRVFSKLVEERRDFKDMLRAALEFSQKGTPRGGSTDLAAATVDRAYEEAQSLQLTRLFEFPNRGRHSATLSLAVIVVLLFVVAWPQVSMRAFGGLAFGYPTPISVIYGELEVVSKNRQVLSGEDVVVRVRDHGPLAPEVTLRFNDTGDLWKTRPLEPKKGTTPFEYLFEFHHVRDHTQYRFESMGRQTAEFTIEVVQRPLVNKLSMRLVPPAYTGKSPKTLEPGRGDAIALLGTSIEISGSSNTPVSRGYLVPDNKDEGAVTLSHRQRLELNGREFKTAFLLRSDIRYHLSILDAHGHHNADPVTYQISALADRPPYIEMRSPEGDHEIVKTMQIPLMIYASDDFGVSRITLVYKHERDREDLGNKEQRVPLQLQGKTATTPTGESINGEIVTEVIKVHDWNVEDIGLFPGDYLTVYFEVEDNDEFSGHKTTRTPSYRFRLPTLGELYAEIREQDDNRVSELEDVLEKGQEVREKFEQLARELKKRPEMDWKKQQEIDRALNKQRELADKVSELSEDLQEELDKLEEQQLVSREVAEKMEQIRELMEQVESEKLKEYMKRMQEAMNEISPEEIQKAMEEMELSQEDFLKRLERTKSLLEQLKREQQLDALVEKTGDLLKRQEDLTDRTEELKENGEAEEPEASKENLDGNQEPQDGENQEDTEKEPSSDPKSEDAAESSEKEKTEELAEEQQDLSEETEKLQEELDKLAEEFKENGQEQLEELNKEMQEQKPSENMKDASNELQQQKPQEANKSQRSAESQMRTLYEQLMSAQQAMAMDQQAAAGAALAKAARLSLDVSFRQEKLSREKATRGDFESSGELARAQRGLHSATGKVSAGLEEMAKQSLMIPSSVLKLLGQAMGKMDQGVRSYEKGNTHAGRVRGEDAYGDLNKAVIELSRSSKSCSSGGGSGGQSSPERMESMLKRQQELNDATRQFTNRLPNPGNMTPEERAQMSKLLGEQQAIEQELADIQRQAARQRDLLGRMDRMQEEIKEVVGDMRSDNVTDETLDLQDRIVSRMLQSQRSLHKRDYNKERTSRSVTELFSEGGVGYELEDVRQKMRRDIQRALESGTPEEYQELVREYFKAIAEADETLVTPQPEQP